ncbi:hypothetical protein JCM8547_006887 [Rhodosporidiobolus lusitaniae]
MPFVNLPGAVRMHYEVLSTRASPSTLLDPSKPTLVALVPFYSVQASELPQLGPTSPLRESHNVVAFSLRSHGRTVAEVKPTHDAFVSAADLAFAFEALQLPPSQIYAPGAINGRIAIAFSVLFPELVSALLLAAPSGRSAMTSNEGFKTLDASMFNPSDVEDLHEIMAELALQLYGDYAPAERMDDLINLLLRRHNPRHATRSYDLCRLAYLSMSLTDAAVAEIKAPVLLLSGEHDSCSAATRSEEWENLLTGSSAVEAHTIPDSPHLFFYTHADETLSHLVSFLSRHPSPDSSAPASPDLQKALRTCASISSSGKNVLLRNPRNPESYSVMSVEEKDESAKDIERMKIFEREWLGKPLAPGAEGGEPWDEGFWGRVARPRWRWSRRHDAQPTSDRTASARFSVASEVVVNVASVQETVKVSGEVSPTMMSVVESKVLPTVPASDDEEDDEDALDSDSSSEDGLRERKDSGFVDAVDDLDSGKQVGVVESMSRLALEQNPTAQVVA